jgi:hypothetical protein
MGMVHYELAEGSIVRMSDMRYGSVRDPRIAMWGADARFDRNGRLRDVVRWQRRDEVRIGPELAALWAQLVGR